MTGIFGCSIYREWKTIEYLSRLGNIVHMEREDLEDQRRDVRNRFRSQNESIGYKTCSSLLLLLLLLSSSSLTLHFVFLHWSFKFQEYRKFPSHERFTVREARKSIVWISKLGYPQTQFGSQVTPPIN